MATGYLKVKGDRIVDGDGKDIVLRGAAIGGWMNMENFITGYPGHEFQHRASMKKVLGEENYEYFFDKWLEYFFTDKDAEYFASLGLNCLRLPFNYRHFEDDMNPYVLKESGFKHLDRVIDLCSKHKIYTILDMHTAPGGHNPDWHSDNPTSYAAFWDYKTHQDRTCWLWERLAERYKDNTWVAGYNPLNEPCDPEHVRLPKFYDRIEPLIRKIDSNHILFLDGNTFAMEWRGFETVLPNCVYAMHDYSGMGFPTGEPFKGTADQKDKLERGYLRKALFMRKHKTPVWNGEFGPVYAQPQVEGPNYETINQDRYNLLGEQLAIYDKYAISWSIWLFKDIGVQGMLHTNQDSKWNKTIQPFLDRKKMFRLDAWGVHADKESEEALNPLVKWIEKICPQAGDTYPTPWGLERHLLRNIHQTFLSAAMSDEFAEQFKGMDKKELEACAHSFHFDECVQREGLNKILRDHAKTHVSGEYQPHPDISEADEGKLEGAGQ